MPLDTTAVLKIIDRHIEGKIPDRIPGLEEDPFLAEVYEGMETKELFAEALVFPEWETSLREQIFGWMNHANVVDHDALINEVLDAQNNKAAPSNVDATAESNKPNRPSFYERFVKPHLGESPTKAAIAKAEEILGRLEEAEQSNSKIVEIGNEILQLSNGGSALEDLEIYGSQGSFFIENSQGDILYGVQDGTETVNQMKESDISKLSQLLERDRAESRESQARINPMELDGTDAFTEHEDQLQTHNEVDRSPQENEFTNAETLLTDRPLSEKEFAVIQSVLDSFAIDHTSELAEILSTEALDKEEIETLFTDLGLDASEYSSEVSLPEEEEEL